MPIPPISTKKMADFWSISEKVGASIKRPLQTNAGQKAKILPYAVSLRICFFITERTWTFFSLSPNKRYVHGISSPPPCANVPSSADRGSPVITHSMSTIFPSWNNCVRGWHRPSGIWPTVMFLFFTIMALSLCLFSGSKLHTSSVPDG